MLASHSPGVPSSPSSSTSISATSGGKRKHAPTSSASASGSGESPIETRARTARRRHMHSVIVNNTTTTTTTTATIINPTASTTKKVRFETDTDALTTLLTTTTTATATTSTTTTTALFEFNRLPAVARRRILMLLKHNAPQAPCVCWLWSQLLNDDAIEMCEHLVSRERRLQATYVRAVRQSELKREMLPMLIDWLVDVGEEFELRPVTLHTAVAYLRWHLALHQVRKSELQLLGATCLLLAAKFHEKDDCVPSVLDFVYMGDSAFTQQAVVNAEIKLVHSLDFELQPTTSLSFLHLYCDTLQVRPHSDAQVFWMSMHLLELAMLRTSTQRLRPSVAAAAALHIAIATRIGAALAIDVWDGSLYMLTGLTPSRAPMSNAIVSFWQLRQNPPSVPNHPLSAITAKFQRPQYARVASVPLPTQPPVP
jgi:cyclin A